MGDVQSRRSPPFLSPTETVSPVVVPQPPTLQPQQSSSAYRIPLDHEPARNNSMDGTTTRADDPVKPTGRTPRLSRGDSAEKVEGLTPITEDTRPGNERPEDQGRSSQTLKELRRQMEELLVYQQMQQHRHQLSSQTPSISSQSNETPRKRRLSNASSSEAPSAPPVPPSSNSTGSTGTIIGVDAAKSPDPPAGPTHSDPSPGGECQATAKTGLEQSGRQGHFRLKLPSEKLKSSLPMSQPAEARQASATKTASSQPIFLPPQPRDGTENSIPAGPNLYDLTLKLNADPGLEAWWSNLVDILQAHYGAERVSLAVPGDVTDLENVPWGQKAIFNQNVNPSLENLEAHRLRDNLPLETSGIGKNGDETGPKKQDATLSSQVKAPVAASSSARPSLLSRHSFAGFGKDKKSTPVADLDKSRHLSKTNSVRPEKKQARIADEPGPAERAAPSNNQRHRVVQSEASNAINGPQAGLRQVIFPTPRPLEVEADPLIKRTGVVKLFGRTSPVVLTRDYSDDLGQSSQRWSDPVKSPQDTVQVTPDADGPEKLPELALNVLAAGSHPYDEYEQLPQSPWSQSPAPSPAPRTHADQNPFFTSHAVDEGAFSKNPPSYDYSNTQPLEAIGIDHSKTVIHIPLLHGGRLDQSSESTLRFPVAIVSLLSTIVPYPPSLRQSLAHLMPHLTTSFCLAQQYSQIERQLASKVDAPRYGRLLGLGGTFSDESSELELVAGLSGHVNNSVGDENPASARASIASPSDVSSTKFSPAVSGLGTPGVDLAHVGFGSTNQSPGAMPRSGGDAVDSYFNVQQPKGLRDSAPQHRRRLSKSKANLVSSTPASPGKSLGKVPTGEENNLLDPGPVASPLQEMKATPVVSPSQNTSRHPSSNSLYAQLQRELPRPFSDTIAQLMLNSLPLHLFLAKPQSGEVIWTNAKFDAYRRSQPQEHKMRDPWQNIHSSERDHVSREWAKALRTGSQFTERVRVKRFNDETAYRWFIFRANPLLSSTGEVLYWIGSFLDIHEQHIAELKAAQEREKFATDAKYRAFSNSVPQVVFEATENRGLIFVNEQWNLYTGQKFEEALDLGFAKHVHPDDLEKCGGLSLKARQRQGRIDAAEAAKASVDNPQAKPSEGHGVASALDELVRRGAASLQKDENGRVFYSTEIRLRSKGGDFRWHLVRVVRVETSSFGSEEASWYGTCTDINDRKNLERELNKAMLQLNNQMESKTKFFSNMSHEIRTPLNGILGTIPFILDTQLDSDQRRMLDTIQNSSTNLRELVDNILDVSRVEAGKMSMVNSWFHVRSMIEDVIDTVASRAIDKGLEINYLIDADVPSMVIGDRFRIRQVLINLVGNAVKFTAQGEVHIRCNIHGNASAEGRDTELFLNFDVVDTGKGFSSQDAERLMQRFSQLGENGSQQHAGSGLGLFLSKQLVEMHGGELIPSSKEGQGAKFSFNVMVDAPPPPSPAERPQLFRQASTASRRPGLSRTSSYQPPTLLPPPGSDSKVHDTADPDLPPGLGYPAIQSPVVGDSATDAPSKSSFPPSAASSALPTPDIGAVNLPPGLDQTRLTSGQPETTSQSQSQPSEPTPAGATAPNPSVHLTPPLSQTSTSPSKLSPGPTAIPSQGSFSIVILCPLDNARQATKQHIEQVVPYEISFEITTLPDVDEWKDMMQPGTDARCTHLVLNLPATDDILEVIQHVSESNLNPGPVVVIISDLYQKRQINTRVKELAATGKQVFIVPKPVKPSAFSTIFDPESKRELSKDRNQDMAREINNNFKTVSKMVKEVLGNKGYRILLVEDDETNRDVMLKYLDKIKLMSETASDGQECTNMVFCKEPGYYSLIICDIQMPVKNGYDTCREIRAWEQKNHYPQIPIMALSANAMTDQIENAARAGFNDYVTKPIKHNELGKMMMGLLDSSRPLLLLRDRLNLNNDKATPSRR